MKTFPIGKRLIGTLVLLGWSHLCTGQKLTLETCLSLAEKNYPQINQRGLIRQNTELSTSNIGRTMLPQITINGQASYQSEVTSLPDGESLGAPELSKDQYNLYGEIVQPLTGLAVSKQNKKIEQLNGIVQEKELETDLYEIKQQVSDLYFGILKTEGQIDQTNLTRQDLEAGLTRAESSYEFGTILSSEVSILKAELIKLEQRLIELTAKKSSSLEKLELFIGQRIPGDTQLVSPYVDGLSQEINRPELSFFNAQKQSLSSQNELIAKNNLPQLSLFFQGGFGRPALNFLSNDFEPYYIGGLRLSWNISRYYTDDQQRQILSVNQDIYETQRETFLFNTRLVLTGQQSEIAKLEQLIIKDREIIKLREEITETSKDQLENGVITATDYKQVVIDEDQARQSLNLHDIELLQLKNQHKITTGNL